MQLRTGQIIPGAETPVGEGINRPVRTTIRVDEGIHAAVIKRIPQSAVLVECFCALLLRGWGLPVPEPILVTEGDNLVFASIDAGYPNLKQRLGWRDNLPEAQAEQLRRIGAAIICAWQDAPKALMADEAIANADRNLGNFLWDGGEHAYIDHERSMGLIPHTTNLMAVFAALAGKTVDMETGAVAAALSADRGMPASIENPEGIDFSPLVAYVETRLPTLATRVLTRFPKPHDLLTGLP